jgi:hypothetical protein
MILPLLSIALAAPSSGEEVPPTKEEVTARVVEGLDLKPTLTLTDRGKGKRRVVRFAPEPGTTTAYTTTTRQSMSLSMKGPDGQMIAVPGLDQTQPTIVTRMQNTVGQPVKDDLVPVDITFLGTEVTDTTPEMKAQLDQAMGSLTGFRMLVRASDGGLEQVDVATEDEQLYQMIQGIADSYLDKLPSFPAEPVGVGAAWTVEIDMNLAGLPFRTTQDTVVTAMEDTSVEVAYTFTMHQGEGDLRLPGMPADAEMAFTHFRGTGTGTMRTDLTTLVATGSSTFDLAMGMRVAAGGQPPVDMDMTIHQTTETAADK